MRSGSRLPLVRWCGSVSSPSRCRFIVILAPTAISQGGLVGCSASSYRSISIVPILFRTHKIFGEDGILVSVPGFEITCISHSEEVEERVFNSVGILC